MGSPWVRILHEVERAVGEREQCHDRHEWRHIAHTGPDDVADTANRTTTVQRGGLDDRVRDSLQGGQVQDRRDGQAQPDRDDVEGRKRPGRAREPVRRVADPELGDHVVEDPVAGAILEDVAPNDRGRRERHGGRYEVEGSHHGEKTEAEVDEYRQPERDDHRRHDAEGDELERRLATPARRAGRGTSGGSSPDPTHLGSPLVMSQVVKLR